MSTTKKRKKLAKSPSDFAEEYSGIDEDSGVDFEPACLIEPKRTSQPVTPGR